MATISFVNKWSGSSSSSTTSIPLTKPTGVVEGDFMIAGITFDAGDVGQQLSIPDWDILDSEVSSEGREVFILFTRFVEAGEGSSYTASVDISNMGNYTAGIVAYRGVDPDNPFIAHSSGINTSNNSTVSTPTLNNTDSKAWWVAAFGEVFVNNSNKSWTANAGTERIDLDSADFIDNSSIAIYDSNSIVTTGNKSVTGTMNISSNEKYSWLGLLRPAIGGDSTVSEETFVTDAASIVVHPGTFFQTSETFTSTDGLGSVQVSPDTVTEQATVSESASLEVFNASHLGVESISVTDAATLETFSEEEDEAAEYELPTNLPFSLGSAGEEHLFDSDVFSFEDEESLRTGNNEFFEIVEDETDLDISSESTDVWAIVEGQTLTVSDLSDGDSVNITDDLVEAPSPIAEALDLSNVGRLPHHLPATLGGLQEDTPPSRTPMTGTLPHHLPATLCNRPAEVEEGYGSVGWRIRCISGHNFSSVLAEIYKFTAMSFSFEVGAVGAGSITFDLDDTLFSNQLTSGDDPRQLILRENLWQIYLDGDLVFSWIGSNAKDVHVSLAEDRQVAISGPGIAQALAWASVLPNQINRFGNGKDDIALKLEELKDTFQGGSIELDKIWNYYGGPGVVEVPFASNEGRMPLAVAPNSTWSTGGIVVGAKTFDITDSGIIAKVQPMTQSAGTNPMTVTRMELSPLLDTNPNSLQPTYIYIQVHKEGTVNKIQFGYQTLGVMSWSSTRNYDAANHKYWRIRELNGKMLFDLAPTTDGPWSTVVASDPIPWDFTRMILAFRVYNTGNTGLTQAQTTAYISEVNQVPIPSSIPLMVRFRKFIQAAQSRGTIPFVVADWTDTEDSAGADWVGLHNADANLGTKLLALLEVFCSIQNCDWIMQPDFKLQLRQREWNEGESDPTLQYHKEGQVIFYDGGHQLSKERNIVRTDLANYIVGKSGDAGIFQMVQDAESASSYLQRETYIDVGADVKDELALIKTLQSYLELNKDQRISWTIKVPHDSPGRQVFRDYNLGDWVGFDLDVGHYVLAPGELGPIAPEALRVMAISVGVDANGDTELELTLQNRFELLAILIQKKIEKLQNKITGL